jgi:hypothetical protein
MRNLRIWDVVWGVSLAVCVVVIIWLAGGERRARAQAATIEELNQQIEQVKKVNHMQFMAIDSCQQAALRDFTGSQVTLLFDPSTAADSHGPSDAPLDLIRPGLGVALEPFMQPSALNPQPQRPRWFVNGRVLPFIAGDPAGARFAWIDVDTGKIEVREAMQVSFQ